MYKNKYSRGKMFDMLATFLYRIAVWLQYRRSKGNPRRNYRLMEIDRLYEIEDFLRNSGESHRANQVNFSRKMLKSIYYEFDNLADNYNDMAEEYYGEG